MLRKINLKILSYKKEIQNIYSDVNVLELSNDLYLQISCSEKIAEKNNYMFIT